MSPLPATDRPRLHHLAEIEQAVWNELERAVRDRGHSWRTPVLATGGTDGVEARTVVLREAWAEHREFLIYTDARSPKLVQIAAQPSGVLVMWCPRLGWQLRCRVMFEIETCGLDASSRWAQLRLTPAAQDYLSPLPPGSPLEPAPVPEAPAADPVAPAPPSREMPPRHHFALLSARLTSLDWLELHREGHRRAVFDAEGARWIQP